MSDITNLFYEQHDRRRKADHLYTVKPERQKLRAKQELENINKVWKREVQDKSKGNMYWSQMMAPKVEACRESCGEEQEFGKRSSGLHSLCGFRFDAKRVNFDA
jgi:hypothetical protein